METQKLIKHSIFIIEALLEYIDAIPEKTISTFPIMPGIDRDYINDILTILKANGGILL